MKKTILLLILTAMVSLLLSFPAMAKDLPTVKWENLNFGTDQTLEIMTWNVQNFPKHENTVEYVARTILSVDPDIIGMQEIKSNKDFFKLVNLMNELGEANWAGYRASSDEWLADLAYIYKTDVITVSSIHEIYNSEEEENSFPRFPLVMEATYGQFPIVVINNHYKARTEEEDIKRRKSASEKLDKYISKYHKDDNVVVLGDLNDSITDEALENVFWPFLQKPEAYRFADMAIAKNDKADWSYPYYKYRGHIDHILISNELFDEMESKSSDVKVVTIDKFMDGGEDNRYKYITDHRPLVLKMKIMNPGEKRLSDKLKAAKEKVKNPKDAEPKVEKMLKSEVKEKKN